MAAQVRERRSDDSGRSRVQRHRATGAGVQGFPLPDSPQLDLGATRRRQAEFLEKGANPRFVVTSLSPERLGARALYEDFYCARGDMENRIKEQQLGLFADRTSAATMRANQLRLYLSSAAYMLMHALRRLGLKQTPLARAQCQTIRLKLLKIGAQVRLRSDVLHVGSLSLQRGLRCRRSKPPGHSSALLRSVPIKRPQKRNRSIAQAELCLNTFRHALPNPKNAPFTTIHTTASLDLDRIDTKALRKPFRPAKITFISKSVIYAG